MIRTKHIEKHHSCLLACWKISNGATLGQHWGWISLVTRSDLQEPLSSSPTICPNVQLVLRQANQLALAAMHMLDNSHWCWWNLLAAPTLSPTLQLPCSYLALECGPTNIIPSCQVLSVTQQHWLLCLINLGGRFTGERLIHGGVSYIFRTLDNVARPVHFWRMWDFSSLWMI